MNVVCFGAHPDDAEWHAGGTLVQWVKAGACVTAVSMTNGDIGHHAMSGGVLARRRAEESARSAACGGFAHRVLDYHDGELLPTLEVRKQVVRLIRECEADVVLTHRPNDYHPDHRYTSMAVQDAAFMVTVPNFCPDVPPLCANPVFLYMMDQFTKPTPFQADAAIAVDSAMDVKWSMLEAMESQMFEWLPWLEGKLEEVPEGQEARRAWLEEEYGSFFRWPAQYARKSLEKWYGAEAASRVEFAELFEVCEYGRQPAEQELRGLFPYVPKRLA